METFMPDKQERDCRTCYYLNVNILDLPCIACSDDNCKWEPKHDCSTCKYQTQRIYDPPCNNCYNRKDFGATQWEPMEIETSREKITDIIVKIEDILHSSGLYWSIHYIPSSKYYSCYISEKMNEDSDE